MILRHFLFLSFFLLISLPAFGSNITWKEVDFDIGVRVYAGKIKGQRLVAFKGIGIIQYPMSVVASVLYDIEKGNQWIANLGSSGIVQVIDPLERIDYNHQKLPWPITDRDFVFRIKTRISPDKKAMHFTLKSEQNALQPPQAGKVRGELLNSYFKTKSIENDTQTEMEMMLLVDPKGLIPKWIVNFINKKWPVKTMNGIRSYLKRSYIPVHPIIASALETSTGIQTCEKPELTIENC